MKRDDSLCKHWREVISLISGPEVLEQFYKYANTPEEEVFYLIYLLRTTMRVDVQTRASIVLEKFLWKYLENIK